MVAIIDEVLAKKLWPDGRRPRPAHLQYASRQRSEGERQRQSQRFCERRPRAAKPEKKRSRLSASFRLRNKELFEKRSARPDLSSVRARISRSNVSFFVRFRSLAAGSEASPPPISSDGPCAKSIPAVAGPDAQKLLRNISTAISNSGSSKSAPPCSPLSSAVLAPFGLAVVGLYGVKAYSSRATDARDRHPDGSRRQLGTVLQKDHARRLTSCA